MQIHKIVTKQFKDPAAECFFYSEIWISETHLFRFVHIEEELPLRYITWVENQ